MLLMFHNHRYQDSKDVWTDWGCFQKRCSSSSNHDSISCLGEDQKVTQNIPKPKREFEVGDDQI
jgi:hypothetical protein